MDKIFVIPSCLAWCRNDDDYVEILTVHNEKILLNSQMSIYWEVICKEKYLKKICEKLKEDISEREVIEMLHYLEEQEILKIRNMDSIFDELFS